METLKAEGAVEDSGEEEASVGVSVAVEASGVAWREASEEVSEVGAVSEGVRVASEAVFVVPSEAAAAGRSIAAVALAVAVATKAAAASAATAEGGAATEGEIGAATAAATGAATAAGTGAAPGEACQTEELGVSEAVTEVLVATEACLTGDPEGATEPGVARPPPTGVAEVGPPAMKVPAADSVAAAAMTDPSGAVAVQKAASGDAGPRGGPEEVMMQELVEDTRRESQY